MRASDATLHTLNAISARTAGFKGALRPVCDEDSIENFDWSRLGLDKISEAGKLKSPAHFKNPSKPTHELRSQWEQRQ